jgi:hypothetical protein
VVVGAALVGTLAGGCGSTPVADAPTVHAGELAAHGGHVCPRQLPDGRDRGGRGSGSEQDADVLPSLLTPESAWICRYEPVDRPRTADGRFPYEWVRARHVRRVDPSTVRRLTTTLHHLGLFDGDRACTADLGPRWAVVYAHGGDLTGVVVDDFGCREVRLTSEPFTIPAGSADGEGTVRGALDGGFDLLEGLGLRSPSGR